MSSHRTQQGDMLDQICRSHYGTEAHTADVYAANPGLAALGPILPMGLVIELPEITSAPVASIVKLWS